MIGVCDKFHSIQLSIQHNPSPFQSGCYSASWFLIFSDGWDSLLIFMQLVG